MNAIRGDAVDELDGIEEHRDQDGRIEVVAHGFTAALAQPSDVHFCVWLGCCRGQCVETVHGVHQPVESLFCCLQRFIREVQRARIVALKHEESHRHGRIPALQQSMIAGDEFFGCEAVAFGLGHLPTVYREHVAVHPIAHAVGFSIGACVLCNLAFVVRKFQIHAPAVNVKLRAEVLGAHHRTFQVPSRESFAPWGGPLHQVRGIGLFPEGEIEGIILFILTIE